jgi:hypothetical protein
MNDIPVLLLSSVSSSDQYFLPNTEFRTAVCRKITLSWDYVPCNFVELSRNFGETCHKRILFTLMLEAVSFPEMFVTFCQATRHLTPEDIILQQGSPYLFVGVSCENMRRVIPT